MHPSWNWPVDIVSSWLKHCFHSVEKTLSIPSLRLLQTDFCAYKSGSRESNPAAVSNTVSNPWRPGGAGIELGVLIRCLLLTNYSAISVLLVCSTLEKAFQQWSCIWLIMQVQFWKLFVFQNYGYLIFVFCPMFLPMTIDLLWHTKMDMVIAFASTNFWRLLVTLPVSVVCVIGLLYIIKSVKRRRAPEFLKLSENMVHSIHTLVNGSDLCLNRRQCLDLSSKLCKTIQNIQKLLSQCGSSQDVFRPSLEHLYRLLMKAKLLVNDCNNENWIGASVLQIQNQSAFQVILLDVSFCYHAIFEQAKLSMSGDWNNLELEDLRDSSTFQPALMKDFDEDREDLKKRLEDLVNPQNYSSGWLVQVYYFVQVRLSKKFRLAEYLLLKQHCIAQQPLSDGLELSNQLFWTEESVSFMTWGREVSLGAGSGASGVCKTKWLGIPCAKKCNIPKPYFLKEAGILSHVNYANIIRFICCGESIDGERREEGDDFIAMELMEMSLSELIKEQEKKGIPFSYDVAVDIMAQIARGMCYLHGLRVAHRDLKPANVVLNVVTSPHIKGNYHVKLVDFGTSKTEVQPFKTTSTEHGFGTATHKAPEVLHLAPAKSMGDRKWRAVWFKADVWSFAIIFLEILSGKLRKSLYKEDQDVKSMVPADCPEDLIALLEDCLQEAYPRGRPDFLEICSRLEALRHNLLRRLSSSDQDSISELITDSSNYKFIKKGLKEHFQRQNAVVIDDDEVELLLPQASHVEQRDHQDKTRTDQAPYDKEMKDLEIWSKQPGNEVFSEALEEWLYGSSMFAVRIFMMEEQDRTLQRQLLFLLKFHCISLGIMQPVHISGSIYLGLPHWCTIAGVSLNLLESFVTICVVIYKFQCLLRVGEDIACFQIIRKVYFNRVDTLKQKRENFSFKDDAEGYDWASRSPPKLTALWILVVIIVFCMLALLFLSLFLLTHPSPSVRNILLYQCSMGFHGSSKHYC